MQKKLMTLDVNKSPEVLKLIQRLDACGRPLDLSELERLLSSPAFTEAAIMPFLTGTDDGGNDVLLYSCDRFEVRCRLWRSGETSSIHDHRGSRCCFRVISGKLMNTVFRVDDGANCRFAGEVEIVAGDVLTMEDRDCHQISNREPVGHDATTLHVYSPPLSEETNSYRGRVRG